jgi:hypothetical protein
LDAPDELLGDVAQENIVSVCSETVLVSEQDRCTVCTKCTPDELLGDVAHKSFWTLPKVLPGDEAQVEARFSPFGDSANLDARLVHFLRQTYHRLGNRFGYTQWKVLCDVGHVKSRFGPFGDSANLDAR